MQAIVRSLAVAGLAAALCTALAGPTLAAEQTVSCGSLSVKQRRVVEHADQDIDALRRYVYITRAVYQLDMAVVAESIDAWRAIARCTAQADAAHDAPEALAAASRF